MNLHSVIDTVPGSGVHPRPGEGGSKFEKHSLPSGPSSTPGCMYEYTLSLALMIGWLQTLR